VPSLLLPGHRGAASQAGRLAADHGTSTHHRDPHRPAGVTGMRGGEAAALDDTDFVPFAAICWCAMPGSAAPTAPLHSVTVPVLQDYRRLRDQQPPPGQPGR
jgi:hypothetical protein